MLTTERSYWILLLLFFTTIMGGYAQNAYPLITNYSPSDYDSDAQTWSIVQDQRGFIYFGNTEEVVAYDGVHWTVIEGTTNLGAIRSLGVDSLGRVYVGAQGHFGYLHPNDKGLMVYHSLSDALAEEYQDFGDVWKIAVTPEGVYFVSNPFGFFWTGQEVKVWEHKKKGAHKGIVAGDQLYIAHHRGKQIYRAEQDSLIPIDAWKPILRKHFALTATTFDHVDPKQASQFLLPGYRGYFLAFDEKEDTIITIWEGLKEQYDLKMLYASSMIHDDLYTIGSLQDGWYAINKKGEMKQRLTFDEGLIDNSVLGLLRDRDGNNWVATNNGISYIATSSPFTAFTKASGYHSGMVSMTRYENRLYIGTFQGLFLLNEDQTFQQLEGPNQVFDFQVVPTEDGQKLIAASNGGLYEIIEDEAIKLGGARARCLLLSKDGKTLYLGGISSVYAYQFIDKKWVRQAAIPIAQTVVRTLAFDQHDNLWVGTARAGAYKLGFQHPDSLQPSTIQHFDTLPETNFIHYFGNGSLAGKLLIANEDGVSYYDEELEKFNPFGGFGKLLNDSSLVIEKMYPSESGQLWVKALHDTSKIIVGYLEEADNGRWEWNHTPFTVLPNTDFSTLYPDSDGSLWIGGSGGIYHYNPEVAKKYDQPFDVHIRKVFVHEDSLLFGGAFQSSFTADSSCYPIAAQPAYMVPEIEFLDGGDLSFLFSASFMEYAERTKYSCQLVGLEEDWSRWSTETKRHYTNLWEGDYIFKVKARNVYGTVSTVASYQFTILPPWYRSIYAYLIFAIAVVAIFIGGIRYNNRRLQRILSRQREVNSRLTQADKLKDEFLANTSHELRTPLNGIIGLAESLLDGVGGDMSPRAQQNLEMIAMSGKRLGGLVNDILDFSKMKDKKLQIQKKSLDIRTITNVVLMLSEPLLNGKNVVLENQIQADTPLVEGDENRLQQILLNIVGNAVKFTEHGAITITAHQVERAANGRSGLVVSIADTGIGIPEDKLESIFASFEQADGDTAREYGGTGLGLAVTKQLVELHGGEIWVESVVGEGSTFSFNLPISTKRVADNIDNQQDMAVVSQLRVSNKDVALTLPVSNATGEYKILVVDDEPVNLQVLENQLSLNHYQVVKANNGFEALDIIEQEEEGFDLVILDVMMPKMSGYEVCKQIRKNYLPTELPVLLLTAKNQLSDLITGFDSGANDYMTKPFTKGELLSRVSLHLELLNLSRKLEQHNQTLELKIVERTAEITAQNEELVQQQEEISSQRDHISEQNKSLLFKNQRITDSIAYAKTIQTAILPVGRRIERLFPSFILYRPKDIVSGDFYWLEEVGDAVYVAVADCTGHGVPGAFMAMIGYAILNEAVLKKGLEEPSEILEYVHQTINKALRQRITENNDGMDIAFCKLEQLNSPEVTLTYAGAKRSLYYIETGSDEISICRGSRKSIGGIDRKGKSFTNEELKLPQGTKVYLTSDGFIDQNGGALNKKFGSKRFLDLIKRTAGHTIEEQGKAIEQTLTTFQRDYDQRDDITVWGIQL